jgi:hypothetical protein
MILNQSAEDASYFYGCRANAPNLFLNKTARAQACRMIEAKAAATGGCPCPLKAANACRKTFDNQRGEMNEV